MTARSYPGLLRGRPTRVVGLKRCPVPGCLDGPHPLFCEKHWPHVSSSTRRELVALMRALVAQGARRGSSAFGVIVRRAVGEVAEALKAVVS